MSAVSFFLLVFLVIVDLAHANNPCGRRFYTTYVTTQTYNDITCTPQEEQEIATMMEGAMDHELKSMGYKMYENIICDNAIVDNRRQLESQNSSESEVQPYLNQTIEGRSRQLGYNFGYQGGGHCSLCPRDNIDQRLLREKRKKEDSKEELVLSTHRSRRLTQCNPTEYVVNREDFSDGNAHQDWQIEDNVSYNSKFKHFLGPLTGDDEAWRRYYIPPICDSVTLMFDFFEIDDWKGGGPEIQIEAKHTIRPGSFWANVDEGIREGDANNGAIQWLMYSTSQPEQVGYGSAKDQSHRLLITFNRAMRDVRLTFKSKSPSGAKAGFGNIQVLGHDHCLTERTRHDWQLTVERRMEIRMMMRSYMYFYERAHCWKDEVPCIHVDLNEKNSWDEAKPNC